MIVHFFYTIRVNNGGVIACSNCSESRLRTTKILFSHVIEANPVGFRGFSTPERTKYKNFFATYSIEMPETSSSLSLSV